MKTNFLICFLITLLCLNPIVGNVTAKSQEIPIHFKVNNFYIFTSFILNLHHLFWIREAEY